MDSRNGIAQIVGKHGIYCLEILFEYEDTPKEINCGNIASSLKHQMDVDYPNVDIMTCTNFDSELTFRKNECSCSAF